MITLDEAIKDPRCVRRFWSKVDKREPDQCWPWTASVNPHGYGQFSLGVGSLTRAHRFSKALHSGPIPAGQVVRHSCDRPVCVNPAHLILGSQLDNIADMHARGRASGGRAGHPGEAHPNARLNAETVAEIRHRRASGDRCVDLAREFDVTPGQISRIARGKQWTTVPQTHRRALDNTTWPELT